VARAHGGKAALVEAVTIYHMVIEGMLALTGQHFIMEYNTQEGVLPAFVEGFQNVARDEHRHRTAGQLSRPVQPCASWDADADNRIRAALARRPRA